MDYRTNTSRRRLRTRALKASPCVPSGFTRRTAGFTLIETLFAVLILGLTIVGPLGIAAKGLQLALISKDQTMAYYLAQDAVEYVHFARDTNCLMASAASACTSDKWLAGNGSVNNSFNLTPCISLDGSASCYIDSLAQTPTVPTLCGGGACPPLYYNPTNKNYTYAVSGNVQTIFIRTITIQTPVGANDCTGTNGCEALLTITVAWSDVGGRAHSVKVHESLFNWE